MCLAAASTDIFRSPFSFLGTETREQHAFKPGVARINEPLIFVMTVPYSFEFPSVFFYLYVCVYVCVHLSTGIVFQVILI